MSSREKKSTLKPIDLGDEILQPRRDFANDLGISERTAIRLNLPTKYIGGCAFIARNASNKILAKQIRRANPRRGE